MSRVTIFCMEYCPYCEKAVKLLKTRGVSFKKTMVDYEDEAKWDELYKRSGMKTLPQVYLDGNLIGGYNELSKLDDKDKLNSLKG